MLHFQPDPETFYDLCRHANAIPIYTSLLSDQLTPVSAFDRVASEAQHAFLLESVVGGEKIARYSFLGANPIAMIETRGDTVTTTTAASSETHATAD
ncbi:MAG: anthranilate synthase component I, partial [Planctomycetes bacterium]|nr:anthranilate synthase component I [Planctomycetota bacterium]